MDGPAPASQVAVVSVDHPLARALCDRCLGRRLVGAAGEVVQCAKAAQARTWPEVLPRACPVCEGAFAEAADWLRCALEAVHPYEHTTFQVGTLFPTPAEAYEREVAKALGQEKVGENIRTEANRWLASAYAQATGKTLMPEGRADVKCTVDTRYWTCELDIAPAYVRGRYNKLRRDIPQTHWPCRRCEGRGCWECNDTGVTYKESVEDSIGQPALPIFGGTAYSFHGAGREDIDALMLGTGRPFILEVARPQRRTVALDALEGAINGATAQSGVAVRELRVAAKEEVAAIKEGEYGKEYLAHCVAQAALTRAEVESVCARLTGTTLQQRTPDRVSHRRADLVRQRRLHAVTLEGMEGDPGARFSLRVHAESGTYIKEMVSGDEGRTDPSFTSLAGVPVVVDALDVVAILDGPDEAPAGPAA